MHGSRNYFFSVGSPYSVDIAVFNQPQQQKYSFLCGTKVIHRCLIKDVVTWAIFVVGKTVAVNYN